MARRGVHPGHPGDHRAGDLRHRRDRHRLDRQPRAGRRARARGRSATSSRMTVVALALGLIAGNLIAPGSGFDGQPDAAARADAKESIGEAGGDQGLVAVHHRPPAARTRSCSRSSRTRSCASSCSASSSRRRSRSSPTTSARRSSRVFEVIGADHLRRHPARHVGRADRRVRRHGLHGRRLRLGLARQPRPADGDVLGHLRVLRVRRPRPGRARSAASASSASSGCSATSC